jgi:hypothetical protein
MDATLNMYMILTIAGALIYLTLFPYMTRDDD